MSFGSVLANWRKLEQIPFGKLIFSYSFSLNAPYFLTIRPFVHELKEGFTKVSMTQRWGVQNHIKTVHAIAVCNLCEMAMGLVTESTIPSHLRWLPKGMDINYLKKATGRLTATSEIDPASFFKLEKYPGEVRVPILIKNDAGDIVTKADIKLWISLKPEKK